MLRLLRAGLLLFLLSACTEPPPADASGDEMYVQLCASCHGGDLEGGVGSPLGPGSNSSSQDDEFLRLTIERGRGRMPSFGGALSEEQMDRLIAFIRKRQGQ